MGRMRLAGVAGLIVMAVSACADPPVRPIPDATRSSVKSISADISGIKQSDTSDIAARGSNEGASRGAVQGANVMTSSGNLLGALLAPVGAAVGGAKGAAEAQSEIVVDEARANLRMAVQETDFGELLRSRLAASSAGDIRIVAVTAGSATAPLQNVQGIPVGHVVVLEYRLAIAHPRHVNPEIGIQVLVTAQVQSPDRKELVHKATWTYCSDRQGFVPMSANKAAILRQEIDTAATILAEAIPYDLYVSKEPRPLLGTCMDFRNLPSGRGKKAPSPVYSYS